MTPKREESSEMPTDPVALNDRLDDLWAQYLELLDRYQSAQRELQKSMASGFFSLAGANFKSSNRRPYGQDFYDNRMKASRRCRILDNRESGVRLSIHQISPPQQGDATTAPPDPVQQDDREPKQQPSPPSTPAPHERSPPVTPSEETRDDDNESAAAAAAPGPRDPLHWFGILVPRELRSAQQSFTDAMSSHLEQVANAARDIRLLEGEINRTRKAVRKTEKAENRVSGS